MPRGGKRPGAGAPKGNLNAVKAGRYSPRLQAIAKALAADPEVNAFLMGFQRRQKRNQRKASKLALQALQEFVLQIPDKNNPLVEYLRRSLAGLQNQKTREKQSVPHRNKQSPPFPYREGAGG